MKKKVNIVNKAQLKKYSTITSKALALAKKKINKRKEKDALAVLDMAQRYYDDAKYFEQAGNFVNAFACLNYSHGWLDCGSRIGLFNVKDNKLFVVK